MKRERTILMHDYSALAVGTIDLGTLSEFENSSEDSLQQNNDRRQIEKEDDLDINDDLGININSLVSEEIYSMLVAWDTLAQRTNVEIESGSFRGFSMCNSEIVYEPARRSLISADPSSPPSRFKRSSKRTRFLSK